MPRGQIMFVLHAHLPYVHHPEYPFFLEEHWLFEAMTETYIPILRMFKTLEREKIPIKLTMSITPPLMEMLANPDLQVKYEKHLEKLLELSRKEVNRTQNEHPVKHKMAKYYLNFFEETLHLFRDIYQRNLLNGFKEFFSKGYLDIITCNATHGYLPFMEQYPQAIRAQLEQAVKTYERHIGVKPRGIWL
ncbi:MAG: DUF1957 domain-containing protein, partial [Fervidobacterium sp.]